MRWAAALIALVAIAACGQTAPKTRSQMESFLSSALSQTDQGSTFSMTGNLTATGGDIPKFRSGSLDVTAKGSLAKGSLTMSYERDGAQKLKYSVISDGDSIFVKPSSGQWRTVQGDPSYELYPPAAIELLRETIYLALSIKSNGTSFINSSLATEYVVEPNADDFEKLLGVSGISGSSEQALLKTATGEVDIYVKSGSNQQVVRTVVNLGATDPSSKEKLTFTFTADFKAAKVATINPPDSAQQVSPDQLLA